jgi:hypothetical protein
MIIISSDNFNKKAQNSTEELFNQCSTMINDLWKKGKAIRSGATAAATIGKSKVWECVAEEARQSGDYQTLGALKTFLEEATEFFNKNEKVPNINASDLRSYRELENNLVRIGKLEK